MAKLSRRILRQKLLEQNLTQERFAEMLGISPRHIRNLCYRDVDISVSLCYRISRLLNTPMEALLAFSKEDMVDAVPQRLDDAAGYRQSMSITHCRVFSLQKGDTYYICPRCHVTLEREFVSYCDRCGQHLNWSGYEKAAVVDGCREFCGL